MGLGGGPVDGDGQPLNARGLEAGGDGRGQKRPVHRHDHAVAQAGAVSRQVEDVVPQQGLAAGQDHHHLPQAGQVVQELFPLRGGQLIGIRPGPRRGPAVETGQVAAPGHLPGQEAEGRDFFRFVDGMIHNPRLSYQNIMIFVSYYMLLIKYVICFIS